MCSAHARPPPRQQATPAAARRAHAAAAWVPTCAAKELAVDVDLGEGRPLAVLLHACTYAHTRKASGARGELRQLRSLRSTMAFEEPSLLKRGRPQELVAPQQTAPAPTAAEQVVLEHVDGHVLHPRGVQDLQGGTAGRRSGASGLERNPACTAGSSAASRAASWQGPAVPTGRPAHLHHRVGEAALGELLGALRVTQQRERHGRWRWREGGRSGSEGACCAAGAAPVLLVLQPGLSQASKGRRACKGPHLCSQHTLMKATTLLLVTNSSMAARCGHRGRRRPA